MRRNLLKVIRSRWLACGLVVLAGLAVNGVLAETPTMVQLRGPLQLIYAPEVQTELGLDAGQIQTVNAGLDQLDWQLWQMRDLPAEKIGAPVLSQSREARAVIERILRPGQLARFDQLLLRLAGWHRLQLPSVVQKLELDGGQQQKYDQFIASADKLADRSFQNLARQEFEWIRANLTVGQRQKLSQLVGRPFDFAKATIREAKAPEFRDVDAWINSPPLSLAALRGKVVVVNFWTFGCINCIHNLPHYRNWYASFPRDQVVQIGIHTPETAGEHDPNGLRRAVQEKGLAYPIAVDNRRANWTAWGNNVWPAVYLVDKQGYVRYWWYGELNWNGATGEQQMRVRIQQLLAEPTAVINSTNPATATTVSASKAD